MELEVQHLSVSFVYFSGLYFERYVYSASPILFSLFPLNIAGEWQPVIRLQQVWGWALWGSYAERWQIGVYLLCSDNTLILLRNLKGFHVEWHHVCVHALYDWLFCFNCLFYFTIVTAILNLNRKFSQLCPNIDQYSENLGWNFTSIEIFAIILILQISPLKTNDAG